MAKSKYLWTIHGYIRRKNLVKVTGQPQDRWTWKPLEKARKKFYHFSVSQPFILMGDNRRSAALLRNLAQELLTGDEFFRFKQALYNFRVSNSVPQLCQQLRSIINTTEKMILLTELSTQLPKSLQEDFHRLCCLQYKNYEVYLKLAVSGNGRNSTSRVIAQDSSGNFKIVSRGSDKRLVNNIYNYKPYGDTNSQHGTSVTSGIYSEHDDLTSLKHLDNVDKDSDVFVWTPQYGRINATNSALVSKNDTNSGIRRVFIERRDDGSLGLGIIGGKEYGTEIMVNCVDPDGPAAEQGVKTGDKILEVNGTDFRHMTHAEAVMLMRNAWNVIMMVQYPQSLPNKAGSIHIRELELIVYPTSEGRLGLSTNRHNKIKYLLVKEVDPHSPAEKAGVVVGDYIVKIDGVDIRTLTERQITSLTRAKRLMISVKRYVQDDGSGRFIPVRLKSKHLNNNFTPPTVSSPQFRRSANSFDDPDDRMKDFDNEFDENQNENEHSMTEKMMNDPITYVYNSPTQQNFQKNSEGNLKGRRPSVHDSTDNWLLSSQGRAAKKYYEKRGFITAPDVPANRSRSADALGTQFERRSRSRHRDVSPNVWSSGVKRYVRSRSQSPHPLQQPSQRMSRREKDVMVAVQMGIEKRQRALRLSLYQTPDRQSEIEWDM